MSLAPAAIRPRGLRCPARTAGQPRGRVQGGLGQPGGRLCQGAGGAPRGTGMRRGPAPRCSLLQLPTQRGADFLRRHVRGVGLWQPGESGTASHHTASWAAPHQQVGWSGRGSGGSRAWGPSWWQHLRGAVLLRGCVGATGAGGAAEEDQGLVGCWAALGTINSAPLGVMEPPGPAEQLPAPLGLGALVPVLIPAALMAAAVSLGG